MTSEKETPTTKTVEELIEQLFQYYDDIDCAETVDQRITAKEQAELWLKRTITALHTSLVAAVVGLEYNENDIDGNHSYDRARQNEGFKYAQEEVLTIINSIFKE